MTQQSTSLLVGLLAGVSAAFLLVSAGSPSSLSFILFAAAALPVLIAGVVGVLVAILSAGAVDGALRLADRLGIAQFAAVMGGSLGGMQSQLLKLIGDVRGFGLGLETPPEVF